MALKGVTGGSIRVEGLADLVGDFYKINRQLSKDLRRELVDIGKIVVDEAVNVTLPQQNLAAGQAGIDMRPNTGRLAKSLRSKMRGQSAVVVEQRRPPKKKFAYGVQFEFGGREFLVPALENKTDDIIEAIDDMFDRLVSKNGFNRGGIL